VTRQVRSLLLCSRPPWPAIGGDRLRTSQLARALSTLGPVHLVATGTPQAPPDGHPFASTRVVSPTRASTAAALVSGFARGRALQESLYATASVRRAVADALAGGIDIVVAHLLRTVPWLPPSGPPVIVCLQDAIAAQAQEAMHAPGAGGGWRRMALRVDRSRLAAAEGRALSRADSVTFITERDRDLVLAGQAVRHAVVPAGVESVPPAATEPTPDRIAFAGNLRTASNQDMATHLACKVLPLVRQKRPQASLDLVGIEAPARIRALGSEPGVRVVGRVDDMAETLARAWVTACPLRFGSGVQNKVLESFAVGTPVVATPRVADSLAPEPMSGLLVGELDEPFAAQLARVLQDPELRDRSGQLGRAFIKQNHLFPAAFAPLLELVTDLVRAP
jgi:polysaccharide biosynthesis protein PslH